MAPSDHKTLKQLKEETNPSQLGDPISLKAETSDTQPTENDKPNKDGKPATEGNASKTNPSQLGDPVNSSYHQQHPTRMALPTPPREKSFKPPASQRHWAERKNSEDKQKRFMKRARRFTYYDDLYGERNEDEDFDRFPDACEDEIDTEDERNMSERRPAYEPGGSNGFFARFATPKSNSRRPMSPDSGMQEGEGIFRRFASLNTNANPFHADRAHYSHTNEVTTPPTPVSSRKKLTPKKFGIFTSPGGAMEHSNTAGEALDDMLRAGGSCDLDDSFPTLDENMSEDEEPIPLPKKDFTFSGKTSLLKDAVAKSSGKLTDKMVEDDARGQSSIAQAASDGDVEDNESDVEILETKERVLRPRGVAPTALLITLKPKRKNRVHKSSAPSDRRTRAQEKVEEEANRRFTRAQRKPLSYAQKAAELKSSNRNKMTARAATLHQKAKKRDVEERGGKTRRVQGVLSGDRNWKGEKMDVDDPVVLVREMDEDALAEYVRY